MYKPSFHFSKTENYRQVKTSCEGYFIQYYRQFNYFTKNLLMIH
jgi:hypothetical protein